MFPVIIGFYYYRRFKGYKSGFEGEKLVSKTLSSALNDEYYLINDVQLPDGENGNIDHVVVGPTGVFAIETKNKRGKIECNGDVWNGIVGKNRSKQARDNALRVYNAIASAEIFKPGTPWIQGVVVFTHKDAFLYIHNPFKVEIMKIGELANYILSDESRRLSSQEIELVTKEILRQHYLCNSKAIPS